MSSLVLEGEEVSQATAAGMGSEGGRMAYVWAKVKLGYSSLSPRLVEVEFCLQSDPHLSLSSQYSLKLNGKLRRDTSLAINNLINLSMSTSELLCEPCLGPTELVEIDLRVALECR
jgi:hypothetical protein